MCALGFREKGLKLLVAVRNVEGANDSVLESWQRSRRGVWNRDQFLQPHGSQRLVAAAWSSEFSGRPGNPVC